MERHGPPDSARTPAHATKETEQTISWPVEIPLYSLDAVSCATEDAVELVLKLDALHTSATMPPLSVEIPLHELET